MDVRVERSNIYSLIANNQYGLEHWQQYTDFRDLIIKRAGQLNIRADTSAVMIEHKTRGSLRIHLGNWTIECDHRRDLIKMTRSEFACLFARELVLFDAARMLVRHILPQPIAEEIIPEMLACPVIEDN
jgi:hypothetical protein